MKRRNFLGAILAAGVAPAVIGFGILMPVRKLWTPYDQLVDAFDGVFRMHAEMLEQALFYGAFVRQAGDANVQLADGKVVRFTGLTAGMVLPITGLRVISEGTTASLSLLR